MRVAYAKALAEMMDKNNNIIALVADNTLSLWNEIIHNNGDRFFDFGICEANIVGISAGLADCGKIPFVYIMSPFLAYRAYEFIRDDVCFQNMNVKLVGNASGISNNNFGPTHHTTEDIAALRAIPNLTILSPATPEEAYQSAFAAAAYTGPVYIRLGKINEKEFYGKDYKFQIGKGVTMREGTDITVISTGSVLCEVFDADEILRTENINLNIINMPTIKPLDEQIIIAAAAKTGRIITLEEHSVYGGLGGAVAEVLAKNKLATDLKIIGLEGFAQRYGWHQDIKKINGLSSHRLLKEAKAMMREEKQ
ncbi:MAG: transketolase [Syntrophomonadaceae bacterium]|jgi:transketolase|nr:transketolase [Syntrophomonadaceae bacterium]